eukprot:6409942-Amphidinium_carterae.2
MSVQTFVFGIEARPTSSAGGLRRWKRTVHEATITTPNQSVGKNETLIDSYHSCKNLHMLNLNVQPKFLLSAGVVDMDISRKMVIISNLLA